MQMKDNSSQLLAHEIFERAYTNSNYKPVDVAFLQNYVTQISEIGIDEFLLYNLNSFPTTYTVRFLACMTKFFNIAEADLNYIVAGIENNIGFFSLIEFSHKFLKVDLLSFIIAAPNVNPSTKKNIVEYYKKNISLLKASESEAKELAERRYGIGVSELLKVTEVMLAKQTLSESPAKDDSIKEFLQRLFLNQ